jgi:outer membrane protein assembly factor BamB
LDSSTSSLYFYGSPYRAYPALKQGLWRVNTQTGIYSFVANLDQISTINSLLFIPGTEITVIHETHIEVPLERHIPTGQITRKLLNSGLNFTFQIQGPKFDDLYIGQVVPGTDMVILQYYYNFTYYLIALNSIGTEMWLYQDTYPQQIANFLTPVFSSDNSTIVCNVYNYIVAMDANSGTVLWKEPYPVYTHWNRVWSTTSQMAIVWTTSSVNSFDFFTGKLLWTVPADNYTRWMTISPDTTSLYGTRQSTLFRMSTASGKNVWSTEPSLFVADGQLTAVTMATKKFSFFFLREQCRWMELCYSQARRPQMDSCPLSTQITVTNFVTIKSHTKRFLRLVRFHSIRK